MNTQNANIYIDEFGNTALNIEKPGTFSHFVYCSIIINSNDKLKAEELRKKITKDHNLGNDIKSKNISEKLFDRRLRILSQLVENLDFTIDVLVVDKSKLAEAQGLKHKRVFYKYFQNFFVKKYNDKYESFSIWADKVGEDFQFELEAYIRNNSISPSLFHQDRFFFISDDIGKEKLIQFADILCGSIGKIFCTSHTHARAQEIFDILHTRMSVDFFPYQSTDDEIQLFKHSELDPQISEITLRIAKEHLSSARRKDNPEEARMLEYLILNHRVNPNRLIPTYDITNYLSNFSSNASDERTRNIARSLRYEGVFVISHSGKSGYKLANSYTDITQQFEHYLKYVIPMLKKIKILNSSIAEQTFNTINILEKDKAFQELRQMLSGVK
ncbi:DUF3800 domain-containing protein [Hymenobacter aquaticus]|uniref:DUF3800 domain-containing protein n=1 Tax=Hymenobacter aquaticus TaxID=1867101 RepID=A0A4Z0Q8L6_9BACT|nr:DUF3800 domain-containing protein [Hymenobacter aquaticus]TGE25052.1 DUF3800 domain-containing protein [Hymenobacter aquaticus]